MELTELIINDEGDEVVELFTIELDIKFTAICDLHRIVKDHRKELVGIGGDKARKNLRDGTWRLDG